MFEKKDEAFLDDLTGVYNRRFLNEYLTIEIKKYKRYYTPFTLLLLDLDNFKSVNDLKGHLEGDRVLKEFVNFLKDYLRKSDILVRYGGDEFIIILPHTEKNAGLIVAKRIIEKWKTTECYKSLGVGVSIGIAQYPEDGGSIDELLQFADAGLYLAKKHGKGRVFFARREKLKPTIPSKKFVNRKNEIESMEKALEDPLYTLILIQGDIGVGKTRLLEEFFKNYKKTLFYGRGFSLNHNFPYYVVRNMLRGLYNERRSEFLTVYKELSPIIREHVARLVPELSENRLKSERREEKEVFLHSIYTFLKEFTENGFVFVVDDIQWIDPETVAFLEYVYKSHGNVKIVGTFRLHEGSQGYGRLKDVFKERTYKIEVVPFGKEHVNELLRNILGEKISHEVKEYVFKNTGGNPYYVEEVVRALFEKGLLYPDSEGVWQLDTDAYSEEVFTPNAENIIKSKLRSLDSEHLKILELMAIYGEPVSIDVLAQLTSLGEGELYNLLDGIERAGLVQHKAYKTYMFPAGLIGDVIKNEMSKGKRVYYHRKVLEYFEKFVPRAIREEKSAFLAYHYTMVGEKEKAAEFYRIAGKNAMSVFAFSSALRYFDESYKLGGNDDVLYDIQEAYYALGKFKEAEEILTRLVEKYPNNPRYLLKLADVQDMLDKEEEALGIIKRLLDEFNDERIRIGARMMLAWIYVKQGRIEDAISLYREIIDEAQKINDTQNLAKAYQELGVCYRKLGRLKEAEECYIKALETEYARRDRIFYLVTKFSLATVIFEKGYMENAIDILKELRDEFKKIGSGYYYTITLINLGAAYYHLGEIEEARRHLEKAEEYVEKNETYHLLSYIYSNFANIHLEAEEYREAALYLEKALEYEISMLDKLQLLLQLAAVYARSGKLEKVKEILDRYRKLKKDVKSRELEVHEIRRLLEISEFTGEEKDSLIQRAEEMLKEGMEGEDKMYIALYLALYLAKAGEKEKAVAYLEKATVAFQSIPKINFLDVHEILLKIYRYLGDKRAAEKEFKLLREELLQRKNFKRLERLEREMEEFLR